MNANGNEDGKGRDFMHLTIISVREMLQKSIESELVNARKQHAEGHALVLTKQQKQVLQSHN